MKMTGEEKQRVEKRSEGGNKKEASGQGGKTRKVRGRIEEE